MLLAKASTAEARARLERHLEGLSLADRFRVLIDVARDPEYIRCLGEALPAVERHEFNRFYHDFLGYYEDVEASHEPARVAALVREFTKGMLN